MQSETSTPFQFKAVVVDSNRTIKKVASKKSDDIECDMCYNMYERGSLFCPKCGLGS